MDLTAVPESVPRLDSDERISASCFNLHTLITSYTQFSELEAAGELSHSTMAVQAQSAPDRGGAIPPDVFSRLSVDSRECLQRLLAHPEPAMPECVLSLPGSLLLTHELMESVLAWSSKLPCSLGCLSGREWSSRFY